MHFIIYPTYEDFFDGSRPNVSELIQDLPNSFIITLTSLINAELHFSENEQLSQFKLFSYLIERQQQDEKIRLLARFTLMANKYPDGFQVFSTQNALELLHQSLIRTNIVDEIEDSTPRQEIAILKALLLISTSFDENFKIAENPINKFDFFRRSVWPSLINQLELNNNIDYLVEMVLAKMVLDHLQFESEYANYVELFLEKNNSPNSFTYLFTLSNLINTNRERYSINEISPFYIEVEDNLKRLFDSLCMNMSKYQNDYSKQRKHYSGIKASPLYKFNHNRFLIIDFGLFARRLYPGLLFDFYKNSGISENPKFSKFLDFKNYIGDSCTENYTLRKVLSAIFSEKYMIKGFNGDKEGFPDAYIRVGNKIFLFEIKDSFFASDTVDSYSYDKIVSEIDGKYNNQKKGTGQLLSQLQKLITKNFEDKSFEELNVKIHNLQIYPILIFTDDFFSLPGIALYLREEFERKLSRDVRSSYKKVHSLTFVNIRFFIENLDLLMNKQYGLDKIIENWNTQIEKRLRKTEKDITGDSMILSKANEGFESIFYQSYKVDPKRTNYIETLFEQLDLRKGLTD